MLSVLTVFERSTHREAENTAPLTHGAFHKVVYNARQVRWAILSFGEDSLMYLHASLNYLLTKIYQKRTRIDRVIAKI